MNSYIKERLEFIISKSESDKLKLKYLNKYLEEISSKINNTFKEYKNYKETCKYTENDINKLFIYEKELMKLTYEKNMLLSETMKLNTVITVFKDEIEQIKVTNPNIDVEKIIQKNNYVINLDEYLKSCK